MRSAATIARYTLLEAARTRLPLLVGAAIVLLAGASLFAGELAIAESTRFQAGLYAAGARLAAVFIAALYVLASMAREFDDKGLEIMLALDVSRAHYLLGKLCGYLAIATLVAAAAAMPLALAAPWSAVLQWGISLGLELAVVVAFALFCIVSLGHLTLAACLAAGFYVLGRSLAAVRLMSANPIAGGDSAAHQVMHWMVEGLALLIPALDEWTRTAWVVDTPGAWFAIAQLAGHGALYVTLLAAAALFDFYRKDL
jgi:ABC-type transport system involved in multi-copper enzyme maturation permease subunit